VEEKPVFGTRIRGQESLRPVSTKGTAGARVAARGVGQTKTGGRSNPIERTLSRPLKADLLYGTKKKQCNLVWKAAEGPGGLLSKKEGGGL